MTRFEPSGPGSPTRLVVRVPSGYPEERRYALDIVLTEWLGLSYALESVEGLTVGIRAAGDPAGPELTLPDVLFSTPREAWLTEASLPPRPLARLCLEWPEPGGLPDERASDGCPSVPMPILYGRPSGEGSVWVRTPGGIALSVDVFGSVFFLLTRYEEVVRRDRDRHERFPATASVAAAEGFVDRPLADEYTDLLWAAMRSLWPRLPRPPSAFRLRLTHDVDEVWAGQERLRTVAHALAGDLIRRRDRGLAWHRARALLSERSGRHDGDPLDTFDLLMETSERHGLRSTFYFMAGGGDPSVDGHYRPTDPPVARLLRRIHDRGHEVGLHASYASHRSTERLRAEALTLKAACRAAGFEQPSWGVRQHYLRFENPTTWRAQDAAGFGHDSTLGWADRVGFRAGTCREYAPFDLLERRPLAILERPLLAMDGALFGGMGLAPEAGASLTGSLVGTCRRHGGEAVLLYHNSWLVGTRWRAYYVDLIEQIAGAR